MRLATVKGLCYSINAASQGRGGTAVPNGTGSGRRLKGVNQPLGCAELLGSETSTRHLTRRVSHLPKGLHLYSGISPLNRRKKDKSVHTLGKQYLFVSEFVRLGMFHRVELIQNIRNQREIIGSNIGLSAGGFILSMLLFDVPHIAVSDERGLDVMPQESLRLKPEPWGDRKVGSGDMNGPGPHAPCHHYNGGAFGVSLRNMGQQLLFRHEGSLPQNKICWQEGAGESNGEA